ncbi:MAG: hypothetical protein ACKVP7_00230 [Hyphomicrobiaceae bacterium]
MTSIDAKFGRIILAGLISGLAVFWSLLLIGGLSAAGKSVPSLPTTAPGEFLKLAAISLFGILTFGIIGSLYAGIIGICCALACTPIMLLVIRLAERRHIGSAIYFAFGGTLAAIGTVVTFGLAFALVAMLNGRSNPSQALGAIAVLLWLAVGGPIAGYAYWRLARADMRRAFVT